MTESSQDEKIKIITYAEVVDVKGFVGNFDVTIRKKARYIDETKCTGCGDCIEKCLTFGPNEWELGLGKRKAVYKPFSQDFYNLEGYFRVITEKRQKVFFIEFNDTGFFSSHSGTGIGFIYESGDSTKHLTGTQKGDNKLTALGRILD